MPSIRSPWVNLVSAIVGGAAFGMGIARFIASGSPMGLLWALVGFLLLGWAVFDRRRFTWGTPESEVDGGRTLE